MPDDFKITTELLYRGALVFALMDAVYIPLLVWRIREETFRRLKWSLVIAAALVWFGIWSWAIGNFWETVYSYVFPAWAQTWVPWIAFVNAGVIAFVLWKFLYRTFFKWDADERRKRRFFSFYQRKSAFFSVQKGLCTVEKWKLSIQTRAKAVSVYCLLSGVLGSLTHAWAVTRGIVTKPPMLQGASPLSAVTIAFFEYIFYWCVILTVAAIMHQIWMKLRD